MLKTYHPSLLDFLETVADVKARLQGARTYQERWSLNQELRSLERWEPRVKVLQRRHEALLRRWVRMGGSESSFRPYANVPNMFAEEKIEPRYKHESLPVEKGKGGCALEEAPAEAAFDFAQRVAREYAGIKGGFECVRRVLQRAYLGALKMQGEPDEFKRLQDDRFWNASLHKPESASTSRWVVHFIMRARTPNIRNLADRYAAILDGLLRDGVAYDDIRIAKMEGVEAAYEAWLGRKRLRGLRSSSRRQGENGQRWNG